MPYVVDQSWLNLTLFGMGIGLLVTLLPLIPGLPIIVLCAVAYYGLVAGWTATAILVTVVMSILAVVGTTAEYWLAPMGAQRGGASCLSSALAALAGLIGLFIVPGIGVILLPIAVVLIVEYLRHRDPRLAGRAATAYFVGWLASNGIELVTGLVMIALFWLEAGM